MKSQKLAAILAVTVLGTCSMTFAENPIIRMNSIEVSAADVEATYIGSGYQLNYKTVDNNIEITNFTKTSSASSVSVVIPSKINGCSVTSIGAYAFNSLWGITEIEIPASVESLAQGSFQWCGIVEKITFAPGSHLKEIAGGAFYQCEKVKQIVLPDSITQIGGAAFKDCKSLEEIVLPEGISKIEAAAFYGESADFKVHYKGSEEQWNAIDIIWSNYKNGGNNDVLKQEGVVDYNYAPADDLPDDVDFDGDASWMGSVAAAAAIGTGAAIVAYQFGTTVYLDSVLPEGADIPVTYGQLAKLMWQNAGSPEPETALAPDADEVQKAMAWAVENELIDAHRKADFLVSRVSVIRAWNKAQKFAAAK